MSKILSFFFLPALFFFSFGETPAQTKQEIPSFYMTDALRGDFNQVAVVVYVNVKSREVVDRMGSGDCEQSTGGGMCLYLLKGEVKEVFKGKVTNRKNFEFYTTTDMDYKPKDNLLGEKVVFLDWSINYPKNKKSLGTLENSTRANEYGIIAKMRKIARKK